MKKGVIKMTEKKRFINRGEHIFQNREWWCSAKGEHCADVIATAMNELINENEKLNSELKELRKKYNDFSDMVEQRLKEMDMGLMK